MPLVRLTAAFVAGAAMPWAFAPYAWRFLGWLALFVFAWLLIDERRHAFRIGLAFGLGWFAIGAWWLAPVFHSFGHLPLVAAWLAELAVGFVLALHPALWAALVGLFASPVARALAFVGAGIWLEWLRGHWLTGLPWTTIGTLVLDTRWQGWLATVGGYGAAVFPLLAASTAALALASIVRSHWAWWRFIAGGLVALIGFALWTPSYESVAHERRLRALLVQPNIPQEEKWRAHAFAKTLSRLARLSRGERADLIIWPEAALPVVLSDDAQTFAWLKAQTNLLRTPILTGAILRAPNGRLLNGAYLIGEKVQGFAGKHHLVPFGEYVPFWGKGWLPQLVPAIGRFAADENPRPLALGTLRLGTLICYESIFPEEARSRVLAGANVLVVLTNDAWYGRSSAAWQHVEAARVRALETHRFVLHATNTGITAVIAPDGRIQKALVWWTPAALQASFSPRSTITGYLAWGDVLALLTASSLLLFAWGRRR